MFPALLSAAELVLRWLTHAAWQAGLLASVVLALTWLLGNRLSPRWRFALWLVVFARLAVPVLPAAPWSVFQFISVSHDATAATVSDSPAVSPALMPAASGDRLDKEFEVEQLDHSFSHADPARASSRGTASANSAATSPSPMPFRKSVSWSQLAAVIWMAGVVVLFLRRAAMMAQLHSRQRHWLEINDAAVQSMLRSCSRDLRLRRAVALYTAPDNLGPATCGIFRPRIVFPQSLISRLSSAELRLILLHELVHVKRQDVLVDEAIAAITILHWFHPVGWLSRYFLRRERELACDAAVLDQTGAARASEYGHVILKTIQSLTQTAALGGLVGMFGGGPFLLVERRIRLIAAYRRPTKAGLLFGLGFLATLALIGLTDAQTKQPQPDRSDKGGAKTKDNPAAAPGSGIKTAAPKKDDDQAEKQTADEVPITIFGRALDRAQAG
jgi:bla regulator protein BlaR1